MLFLSPWMQTRVHPAGNFTCDRWRSVGISASQLASKRAHRVTFRSLNPITQRLGTRATNSWGRGPGPSWRWSNPRSLSTAAASHSMLLVVLWLNRTHYPILQTSLLSIWTINLMPFHFIMIWTRLATCSQFLKTHLNTAMMKWGHFLKRKKVGYNNKKHYQI